MISGVKLSIVVPQAIGISLCNTSIIQHKVPLNPNVKPFRQKLRRINPDLFLIIEKEVKKLLDAKIIVPLRYSSWVANLVPVRKKEWRNKIVCRLS